MTEAAPATAANPARKKALLAVAAAAVLATAAYVGWHSFVAAGIESTDNAYVQGNLVQITPQVAGTIVAIHADDTQLVKAGQRLVELDPADAQVALDQAEAQLAQTVREVRALYANNATLSAQVALREADVVRVQADVAKAEDDVSRRRPLLATGAVGKEEFEHANAQLQAAQSALAAARSAAVAAREQLAANRTLTDGTSVEHHPSVQRAAARVREAWLAYKRSGLVAPVDGVVARRSAQVGQRVAAGTPLMAVVPLDALWVDANFKEGQLRQLRIGQPATLQADVYGSKVEYHGRVAGLGAGTGAAFALLPAQNATGNWIKIVQRVPVRIALDPAELKEHPLRVGLSMEVEVDVRHADGPLVAEVARSATVAQTRVFDDLDGEADAAVRRIVAANLGRPLRGPVTPAAGDVGEVAPTPVSALASAVAAPAAVPARSGANGVVQP